MCNHSKPILRYKPMDNKTILYMLVICCPPKVSMRRAAGSMDPAGA